MKVVVHNPHRHDRTAGIHDYIVEYLREYRPSIQLSSPRDCKRWAAFLWKKNLPKLGWNYVCSQKELDRHDAWICFAGSIDHEAALSPRRFKGLKLYHLMDYVFESERCSHALSTGGIDYVLCYAQLDQWCPLFQRAYPDFAGRVVSWPFGYSPRFDCRTPFSERTAKCSAMGAVNKVLPDGGDDRVLLYSEMYKDHLWAHPVRQMVRSHPGIFGELVASFLPEEGTRVRLDYDSPFEMNRYQLFLNDDSVMHFPPARTFEGIGTGAVMVSRQHACFEEYGFKHGLNCVTGNVDDPLALRRLLQEALSDQKHLADIHQRSLKHAQRFAHKNMATSLNAMIEMLLAGKKDNVPSLFSA